VRVFQLHCIDSDCLGIYKFFEDGSSDSSFGSLEGGLGSGFDSRFFACENECSVVHQRVVSFVGFSRWNTGDGYIAKFFV